MHDAHCHLDLYPNPALVARSTEDMGIRTLAVTSLPSAFFQALPHVSTYKCIKAAVGLHPLLADHHTNQQKLMFKDALKHTRYVGEIGLDLSREGLPTKDGQIASFRFVLNQLQGQDWIISVHSRRAESAVLDLLTEFGIGPVIFHWYSGPLKELERAISAGHFFSVNTSMTRSNSGNRIIERIPRDRLLTETDGPFVKVNELPAMPRDVQGVIDYLANSWRQPHDAIQHLVDHNLHTLHHRVGLQLP